jgi:hypothetical protein
MPQRELWTKEPSLGDKFLHILRKHWKGEDDSVEKTPESLNILPKKEIKDESDS